MINTLNKLISFGKPFFFFVCYAEVVGLFVTKYLNNNLEKYASTGYPEFKR